MNENQPFCGHSPCYKDIHKDVYLGGSNRVKFVKKIDFVLAFARKSHYNGKNFTSLKG